MVTQRKSKSVKLDAIQIENGALEQEGKFIAAQIKAMRGYEAVAKEKAGVELKKAQDNRDTIEQRLADVHARCKADGFKAFKAKYCSDFGKTKIYQILAIGYGKKTHAELDAENAKRQAKHQAKLKTVAQAPRPLVTDTLEIGTAGGKPLDTADFSAAAQEQSATAVAESNPPQAGSAVTAISTDDRKAPVEYLVLATSPAPKKADPDTAMLIADKEEKSKASLAVITTALDELKNMTTVDKQTAWERFIPHPAMIGVKRVAPIVGRAA